jgi:hypothetical protein
VLSCDEMEILMLAWVINRIHHNRAVGDGLKSEEE